MTAEGKTAGIFRVSERSRRVALASVAVAGLLATGGCSWSNHDEQNVDMALSRASTAVAVASNHETRRYAGPELAIAREKLDAARQAAQAEEYESANRLISESLVNLQLATVKAGTEAARAEIDRTDRAQTEGAPGEKPDAN